MILLPPRVPHHRLPTANRTEACAHCGRAGSPPARRAAPAAVTVYASALKGCRFGVCGTIMLYKQGAAASGGSAFPRRHPVCSVRTFFARPTTCKNSCAVFRLPCMDRALQRNSCTRVFLMARGKHPGGVSQRSHFWGVWRLRQIPAGPGSGADELAVSPGWVKADRRRSTMPDRDHSAQVARRRVQTQATHQRLPVVGVALLQCY